MVHVLEKLYFFYYFNEIFFFDIIFKFFNFIV